MNYIQLINQFWHCHKEHSFTPNETAVYFAILDTCNGLLWKNPFNQSNRRFADKCNVTEPTFIKARNVLKQRGLIDFKSEPGRRHNTVYTIKYLKSFSISGSINDIVSDSVSDMVSTENRLHYNKHTTSSSINETKPKVFVPPLIDEVVDYFVESGYQEAVARKAWAHYNKLSWKDANGRRVKSWKSKMQSVWFKEENKQVEQAVGQSSTGESWAAKQGLPFKSKAKEVIRDLVVFENSQSWQLDLQTQRMYDTGTVSIDYFDSN